MRATRHLVRRIIAGSAAAAGYRVSGNHIFTAADYRRIAGGETRLSVAEAPHRHPARIVRAAELLARTFR